MNDEFDINDIVNTTRKGFRHVVIIGAGASKASCIRNHEMNGKKVPLMKEILYVIDLSKELKKFDITQETSNFEQIYSTIYKQEGRSKRLKTIEKKIRRYFESLQLPNIPTIYDYLVLSLRSKDLIATFNWDPFLWQAYERNLKLTNNLPNIAFLHGNVAIGKCDKTNTIGPIRKGIVNLKTGEPFQPIDLLYPIDKKDYSSDPFIIDQWDKLRHFLKSPAIFTIFGYSAPDMDVDAISVMKKAWGKKESKPFTFLEIINTDDEERLKNSWDKFIFGSHYKIYKNFFDSFLAKFPRRSGEAYEARYLNGKWFNEIGSINTTDFHIFWKWYKKLIEKEIN